MKKIYYLQKIEVELGDLIAYKGFKTTVTEELIELNPELFRVEKNTQPMYFKCVKGEGNYTKSRIYKQKYSTNYPIAISLTNDKGITENVHYWEITNIKHAYNCFELTTKEEWDKQELLDKAKRDYPVGTVFRSLFGKIYTVGDKSSYSLGAGSSILIDGMYIYRNDRWAEILPLRFTSEDGVGIYGDMKTYMINSRNPKLGLNDCGDWIGIAEKYKYFYHKENALAYIEKHKEKTLEDYEQMLFKKDDSMTFSPKSSYFSVYGWLKDNEPKLYYTKLLQLIADDLHGERYTHIYMDTSYHINNAYGVNVHCGDDEGCVYFKSNKLAIKARDILGGKIKYLFNQA